MTCGHKGRSSSFRSDLRVLILGQHFSPELTGIARYSSEMAEWLAKQGCLVRVITPVPSYPGWRVVEGYSSWRYRITRGEGMTIYHCPAFVPRRPSALGRMLHLASFLLSSLPVLFLQVLWRPKLVFQLEPPLLAAPLTIAFAWVVRAKSWLHIQDFEFDAALKLGMLRGALLTRFLSCFERWLRSGFTCISTISPNMLKRLRGKVSEDQHTLLFPNWVDTTVLYPLESGSRYRDHWQIPEKSIVVLYSGSMGRKQGLETVIELARLLEVRSELRFVMVGEGAIREELTAQASGLQNISFHDLVPESELNELLNMADIHLLPQKDAATDLVLPSKLACMLATGKPVVAGARPESQIAKLISGSGFAVAPEDAQAFAHTIQQLLDAPEQRLRLGREGRKTACREFDKQRILRSFSKEITKVVKQV